MKRIECIAKSGKDSDLPKEIFPDLDLSAAPVVINAVETTLLSPTEEAYYFASTSVRSVFAEKEDVREQSTKELTDEAKNKRLQKAKEVKKRKRKTPELTEKSDNLSDEGEMHDEQKMYKDNTCMACGVLYKVEDTMIRCDGNCIGWYHMECAHLTPKDIEKYKTVTWKCEYCLKGVDPPYAKKNINNEPLRKKKKTSTK